MAQHRQSSRWQKQDWEREPEHHIDGYCNWCTDPGWQYWHCARCGAELPEEQWPSAMDVCSLCDFQMTGQIERVTNG